MPAFDWSVEDIPDEPDEAAVTGKLLGPEPLEPDVEAATILVAAIVGADELVAITVLVSGETVEFPCDSAHRT